MTVGIRCKFSDFPECHIALLDTGAARSVIGGDVAEQLMDQLDECGSEKISTRLGLFEGPLNRMTITLLADQGAGNHLEVDAVVMLCPDWDGPLILGFYGFLEHLRIAFDPGVDQESTRFFFGKPGTF